MLADVLVWLVVMVPLELAVWVDVPVDDAVEDMVDDVVELTAVKEVLE